MKLVPFTDWLYRVQKRRKCTEGQAKQIACDLFGIGQNTCYVYCREKNVHVLIDSRNKTMKLLRETAECDSVL